MKLEKWDVKKDGEFSEAKLKKKIEAWGYSVSRYIYSPGTYFPDHTHSVDKVDAVVSGKFRMTMPEGEVVLGAGDCLFVPRGTVHSAEAVSHEPVVSLDAVRIG